MIGKTFTRLTVTELEGRYVVCKCECGNVKRIRKDHLTSGKTRSCGCLRSEITSELKTIHGMYGTRVYRAWCNIKDRCNNPNKDTYSYYGGRGIKIYPEWDKSFESFYEYIGDCPNDEMTIERIDVNGNYEPGNIKWATREEQQQNRTDTEFIEMAGIRLTPHQWCDLSGVKFTTYQSRVGRGWDKIKALSVPPISPKKRRDGIPAEAQKTWLDKILELAIEAGLLEDMKS